MASITFTSAGRIIAPGGFTQEDDSATLVVVPHYSNEINFGGTDTRSEIWFGYSASGSRGKPTTYVLGGTNGSAAISAGSYNASSTRKIKHDIEKCEDSMLDAINNINIVSYVYNNDETEKTKVGFIAEDTDELFSVDHKHMDINTCVGALIKSIQELNIKIKELEKRKEELINGNNQI